MLTLKHISKDYNVSTTKVHALRDVSLSFRQSEFVAVLGPSGGGKTTLCNLIPRFTYATSGHVCIDGRDVKTVTLESLRRAIGIVQQDVYLFSGTVYENILYGRPDATAPRWSRPQSWPARTSSSRRCTAATTPMWASAASSFPAGRSSASPLPAYFEKPAHPHSGRGHQRAGQ